MVGFTKLAVHLVLCNSSEVRAFTKDRRKLGLMALKIQIFISKLLVKYYTLRLPCFLEWTSFSIFFYAKIINHALEQEVELKHPPCQLSILTISTFTRLQEA